MGMNPKAIGSAEDPGTAPKVAAQDKETVTEATDDISEDEKQHPTEETKEDSRAQALKEDESRLLFQEFLLDPDFTTKEWLEER